MRTAYTRLFFFEINDCDAMSLNPSRDGLTIPVTPLAARPNPPTLGARWSPEIP